MPSTKTAVKAAAYVIRSFDRRISADRFGKR
jgi:hypothetical protein